MQKKEQKQISEKTLKYSNTTPIIQYIVEEQTHIKTKHDKKFHISKLLQQAHPPQDTHSPF